MRMKIINVISWGYETGGAESYVQSMNSYLRAQGHQVITLASDSGPNDLRFDDFQFRTIPTHGLKKLLYTAYNVHTRGERLWRSWHRTNQMLSSSIP